MTGYDYEEVTNYIKSVQSAAKESMDQIINILENKIIVPASTSWYAPEGVKFFETFSQDVESTKTTVETVFASYLESIKSAANNWELNMQAEQQNYNIEVEVNAKLDVTSIKDRDGSKMGIIEDEMTKIENSLGAIEQEIKEKLSDISERLTADSAFLGGGQATAINSCFVKVNAAVADVFKFLSTNLKPEIQKAVIKYGEISKETSNAFND